MRALGWHVRSLTVWNTALVVDQPSVGLDIRIMENAECLLRPKSLPVGDLPPKTARSAHSLCLGEVGFAAPQRFLIARMDDCDA